MPATSRIRTNVRSDATIAREIRRKMKADLEVPENRIRTTVEGGFVTLEGIVAQNSQKKAAEACVSKIRGVREVANKIGVESAA